MYHLKQICLTIFVYLITYTFTYLKQNEIRTHPRHDSVNLKFDPVGDGCVFFHRVP